jgi:predicted Rdx family selenoprotein
VSTFDDVDTVAHCRRKHEIFRKTWMAYDIVAKEFVEILAVSCRPGVWTSNSYKIKFSDGTQTWRDISWLEVVSPLSALGAVVE